MDLVDIGLWVSYLLIILCTLAAVVIPLIKSLDDPSTLIKGGIGLGALVVIFLICFAISDGNDPDVSSTTSKMVGAGLKTMYTFVFLALGGIVYTEFAKRFG
jgi:hypothetical protein